MKPRNKDTLLALQFGLCTFDLDNVRIKEAVATSKVMFNESDLPFAAGPFACRPKQTADNF